MAGASRLDVEPEDLSPQRAAVVPRVRLAPGGASEPLEAVVRRLIDARARGPVLLFGAAGGGKSTALAHLLAVLPPSARLTVLDEPPFDEIPAFADSLGVVALRVELPGVWLLRMELVPWCEDDWIEYCVARRRDRCGSVLSRLRGDRGKALLKGSPQLWRIALDRMAADEDLGGAVDALRDHLDGVLSPGPMRDDVAPLCARALIDEERPIRVTELSSALSGYAVKLLRHRAVRVVLAAEYLSRTIASLATSPGDGGLLAKPFPPELLRETARSVRALPGAMARLDRTLGGAPRASDAMAASVLLTADPNWRPRSGRGMKLRAAQLPAARWAGVDLRWADLDAANLRGSDLSGATLRRASADQVDLRDANLSAANLSGILARAAAFGGANLSGASLVSASLGVADLSDTDLRGADLTGARCEGANFNGARLVGTKLRDAIFGSASFEDADLIGADLERARFHYARFGAANVSGVSFRLATLHECDLEQMRLPSCDFSGADLTGSCFTGSFIPHGNFHGAKLCDTGLAEIDWEHADLRDADLRGCTFHMGSTRSGLVGSTVRDPGPCEGSRTGFYTDDFDDRGLKPPEEIRKANLCFADLRGANLDGVDFYLVDLRGARYTGAQAEHFARCGAILRTRVA